MARRRAHDNDGGASWVDRAINRAVTAFAARMLLFELTEALAKGGSANAKRLHWDDGEFVVDSGAATEKVYDAIETFVGASGTRGFAIRFCNRFVVIQLGC